MEQLFGIVEEPPMNVGPPPLVWELCVEQVRQTRPVLLSEYLGRHGLSELPEPVWVDPENATVWHRTPKGEIDSCRKRLCDGLGGGLAVALERDFLLAPPLAEAAAEEIAPAPANPFAGDAVDAAAEVERGPDGRAAAEPDPEPQKREGFRCKMVFTTGRACNRVFTTQAGLKRHQTVAKSHRRD